MLVCLDQYLGFGFWGLKCASVLQVGLDQFNQVLADNLRTCVMEVLLRTSIARNDLEAARRFIRQVGTLRPVHATCHTVHVACYVVHVTCCMSYGTCGVLCGTCAVKYMELIREAV